MNWLEGSMMAGLRKVWNWLYIDEQQRIRDLINMSYNWILAKNIYVSHVLIYTSNTYKQNKKKCFIYE